MDGVKWYRDAQGRTRMEHGQFVSIMDCVATAHYRLDANAKVASRQRVEVFVDPWPEHNPPETIEDLGSRVIHGLMTVGKRKSWTTPNMFVSEIWTAPQFGGMLIENTVIWPNSVVENDIENLSLEEPPAELFQVPPDYTIKDAPDTPR